jgi:hypothetical protein
MTLTTDDLEHIESRIHGLMAKRTADLEATVERLSQRIADLELIAAAAIVHADEGTNPVLEAGQGAAVAAATRRVYERVMFGGPDAGERRRDQAEDR